MSAQIIIKDSIAIAPRMITGGSEAAASPTQTCYNIIYELNATAVKTPRPRIIFITEARTDTLVYCTSVFNCGVFGLFDNSTYPIGPVTNLDAQVNITYSEGANASGTVVSYPTVEIRPTTTRQFDVKTLEVILHYDPVYYVPANIVFGYVHFRIAPAIPPTLTITFPGEDTTIVVTDEYLPTIVLKEMHTPDDAIITWSPGNSISAADYITPEISEATVTVDATATRECGGEQSAVRKITFRKEEAVLEVIEPKPDDKTRKEITNEPKMPELIAKSRLKNYTGGTVLFDWKLTAQWENKENYGKSKRLITETFTGTTTASNDNVSEWKIDWKNKTRGGKDVMLEVTASAGGKTYTSGVIDKPYEILGMNPTPAMVKEGLAIEEQVIVYMESKPKWKHFVTDFNFPIFGDPHGYGLMQLDFPSASDEQVWNWKANKEAGKALFAEKKSIATNFPKSIRNRTKLPKKDEKYLSSGYKGATDFNTTELILRESFQRYNGGNYWFWKPNDPDDPEEGGEWFVAVKPRKWEKEPYGTRAWSVYQQVINANNGIGTYPKKWN
ncbi:MAG: hypothetical protein HYV29_06725 [Ignavibacteriales bacterium]|nr:hypothetical protein [Ignavibacteriales bacterium]